MLPPLGYHFISDPAFLDLKVGNLDHEWPRDSALEFYYSLADFEAAQDVLFFYI